MQHRVKNIPNIEILWEHQTKEILGDDNGVNGVLLSGKDGGEKTLEIQGFFLAIGHHPNSEIFADFIETDEHGYIITQGKSTYTNVPGVFAAGDVQDTVYRQGTTAVGSGCMAAIDADRFMIENPIND
jgi:thioredoxin reductase (NADPH)